MKKVFILSLVLFSLFSCGESTSKTPKPPTDGVHYVGDSVNFIKYIYKDGIIISEQPFVDNKANGVSKDYYANGNLRLTVEYKDAKREGLSVTYYETGEKHSETSYKNGKKDGIKYIYKKDGSITSKVPFADGMPIPPLEEFDVDGKPIPQPTIKFKMNGNSLRMELSDKSFTGVKFFQIKNDAMIEVPMTGNVGNLSYASRGIKVRAYYKTPRGAEGAVDGKY